LLNRHRDGSEQTGLGTGSEDQLGVRINGDTEER